MAQPTRRAAMRPSPGQQSLRRPPHSFSLLARHGPMSDAAVSVPNLRHSPALRRQTLGPEAVKPAALGDRKCERKHVARAQLWAKMALALIWDYARLRLPRHCCNMVLLLILIALHCDWSTNLVLQLSDLVALHRTRPLRLAERSSEQRLDAMTVTVLAVRWPECESDSGETSVDG